MLNETLIPFTRYTDAQGKFNGIIIIIIQKHENCAIWAKIVGFSIKRV